MITQSVRVIKLFHKESTNIQKAHISKCNCTVEKDVGKGELVL